MKRILILVIAIMLVGCDAKNVITEVDYPLEVNNSETFEINCSVTNTGRKSQDFVGIDLYDEYLEGIAILSIEPDYDSTTSGFGMQSYYYDIEIPGGETIDITITAQALYEGDYGGNIDFCINNDVTYVSEYIRTVVSGSNTSGKGKKGK